MVQNVIIKTKLNVSSMVHHGSVAVIILFVVGIFFGVENVMLAFPIALTSAVMGRRNFHVKTINKGFRLMAVDLIIVIAAHIASLNIYIGVLINLVSIFLIMYTIVSLYDLNFYKPFLMLFIFTQYAAIPTSQLYLRIIAVILGIMVVTLASFFGRKNEKNMVEDSLMKVLENFTLQLENILKGDYDEKIEMKSTNIMRTLAYRVYVTRYKGYFTTKLGEIEFRIFVCVEYFNLRLKYINEQLKENYENKKWVNEILMLCKGLSQFKSNKNQLKIIHKGLKWYELEMAQGEGENESFYDLIKVINNIIQAIEELNTLEEKEINKIYEHWERTDIDNPKIVFKEYFFRNSIRMKFALRMSITMTVALFWGEVLGYYKIIWAIITVMSIMQPYYEDTKAKAKERMIGNALAILVTGVVINLVNNQWVTISILIISLYLLYGFKEYYKISLFAGMSSICIASLNENINKLIFYRVWYVILGVVAVMIINKYLFPYNLTNGLEHLGNKMIRLVEQLIRATNQVGRDKNKEHEIRDLTIHLTLLNEKLYLRNLTYGHSNVNKFIGITNRRVIEAAYISLFSKNDIL